MNEKEKPTDLIVRVLEAVCQANVPESRIPTDANVLTIKSYTGLKIRHFLNNLCEPDGTIFLEIGAWNGGTAAAAAFGNKGSFTTIDNFCEFGGNAEGTRGNFAAVGVNVKLLEADCWKAPQEEFPQGVNVFFYDGAHDYESHRRALAHFLEIMAPLFVFLVDDWEDPLVRQATFKSIEETGMRTLAYLWVGSESHEDAGGWWNGLGIFVLSNGG